MSITKRIDLARKTFAREALSTDRKWFRSALEVPAAGVSCIAGYLPLGLGA